MIIVGFLDHLHHEGQHMNEPDLETRDTSPSSRKRHRLSYSLNSLSLIAAALLLTVSLLGTGSVSYFYQTRFRNQYLEYMVRLQTQFSDETASTFKTLNLQLFQLAAYNTNVSLINSTRDDSTFYRAKMTLYRELSNLAPVFPEIDGLFFYSPAADDYTPFISRSSASECSRHIRDFLAGHKENLLSMASLYRDWQLVRENGKSYLVRYVLSDNSSVLGAWSSLSSLLSSFRTILPEKSVISMLDSDFQLLQPEIFPDYAYDPSASSHYQDYTSDGVNYLVNVYETPYSSCRLIIFTPASFLRTQMSSIIKSISAFLVLVLVITFTLSLLIKRLIDQPIRPMKQTLKALQEGTERTPMLVTDSRCIEVQQMFQVLNSMLGDIQALERQVYADQLAQSRLELQFLKSQITPHFLINCLNTFSYLASSPQESDHATAQRLTQTLSQHIRYSFASGEMIPLHQEFDHLDNYLELACIRYPGSLSYELNLPDDCRQAGISPMSLLTLCENSVKHNLIMGEWLRISISAQMIQMDGAPAVHICFMDSGTGYPPEILEKCNHILEHPEIVEDGKHIGIYNIVKSLQLVFSRKAQITFSNEPASGARVDIRIPFISKEETP